MMNAILFLSMFMLYLSGMAPSITVGDSGEFCAAGAILGLPHSPGYPLYCLLAKAFIAAVPWGSIAYRVNLLSAAAAAASVSLMYTVVRKLLERDRDGADAGAPAAFAVLALAVSPAFWHSAIQAEVFALNTAFAAGILYAFAVDNVFAGIFLFGLGLGNHHTLVFLAPLLAWQFARSGGWGLRRVAAALACFAAGFSVYAYLPIRSFKNPALDWGNPETLHNLWRVISRADYGTTALTTGEKIARTALSQLQQLGRLGGALSVQFTAVGLVAGIAGWYLAVRKKSGTYGMLLATWFLIGPGFLLLANMPFDAQTAGILERFYILGNLFWVFPLAWLLRTAARRLDRRLFVAAGTALAVLAVFVRAPEASWRTYYLAYDYGRNIFRTLAPRSIFFMQGGDDTFYSTAYLQFAEGRRRDVELHDRGGLVFKNIYGADFRELTREQKEERRVRIERASLGVRPVYYSTFNRQLLPGIGLNPDGILYCAGPGNDTYGFYSLRSVYAPEYRDYRSRELVPVYPYFASLRREKERLASWDYLYGRWGDAGWVRTNLRVEMSQEAFRLFSGQRLEGAEAVYRKILVLFPDDTGTMVNLGVIREKMHDRAGARQLYARAMEADPGCADAYYNTAVLSWQEADWRDAVRQFERLLEVNPHDSRALQYLPLARQRYEMSRTPHSRQ